MCYNVSLLNAYLLCSYMLSAAAVCYVMYVMYIMYLMYIMWYSAADAGHKLTLLYLANDIVQNSRKKGSEYKAEFSRVLPRAFHVVSK